MFIVGEMSARRMSSRPAASAVPGAAHLLGTQKRIDRNYHAVALQRPCGRGDMLSVRFLAWTQLFSGPGYTPVLSHDGGQPPVGSPSVDYGFLEPYNRGPNSTERLESE